MNILETARLVLREFAADDVNALCEVLCDPVTMCYYPAPLGRKGVEQWIERNRNRYARDGHGLWAMVRKADGELIGDCGLTRQTVDGIEETEIGYHVHRAFWGRGYAPEAARACRDYGFGRLKAERLISLIRPKNLPSRRVAEKIGMTVWKEVLWRDLPHCVYRVRCDEVK